MSESKHIHFIGICGVAMGGIAIAMHKAGFVVTGSDKGFFPPVSTELEKSSIVFYAGWHPENVGKPDLVVLGSAAGTQNPELVYAKKENIEILSYPEVLAKFFLQENSIVTAGTWGKTTSTALLAHILCENGLRPSYMIGGIPLGMLATEIGTDSGKNKWSVIEGDEYKSSPIDSRPKFTHYFPTHLLLSGVSWDHADLYPTEDAYFAVFENLVANIPESGLIVACIDDPGVRKVIGYAKARVVTYGKRSSADYRYVKVGESRSGLRFGIMKGKEAVAVDSQLLGNFQAENITGCFAMAKEIGVPVKKILSGISSFQGIKRRLEKRFENDKITIFDDIAHSPEKAKSVLRDLHAIYRRASIVAVFEPNIGSRTGESAVRYTDAFSSADTVIIPHLTKLKVDQSGNLKPLDGKDLAKLISRSHSGVRYIEGDEELVTELVNTTNLSLKYTIIAFLGSHGFRGMIEQTIEKLSR